MKNSGSLKPEKIEKEEEEEMVGGKDGKAETSDVSRGFLSVFAV